MTQQLLLTATACLALAAANASAVSSTSVIVTAEAPQSAPASSVTAHDVIARVGNQPGAVTSWHALRDDPAGLELWIMIDDGTDTRIGTQFGDIKAFIQQQPPEVRVAIGYLRNGSVQVAQSPTADRAAANKALRLPIAMPGISGSPYIALADFLHHLPKTPQPREVVFISSGIDPYYGPGPQNPYLLNAISDSQKAGVPIYSIYFSGDGRAGHRFRQIDWGQNDLSQLSEETGGEFYWQGTSNPVAFEPFFKDVNRRIAEQYVMKVDVPTSHSGFDRLHLHTEAPQLKLVGPSQIYHP